MSKSNGTLIGREVEQKMSAGELILHLTMILCTCGMWYPVYRSRKSKIDRTTNVYAA
jgi:hypothetical protein